MTEDASKNSEHLTQVEVEETLTGRYTQKITSGNHSLIADEPVSLGGNDDGPGPYDYLLMGLGACTSMTIRMYAERKQLPLERVCVRLHHHKIHVEDCNDCESTKGKVDEIMREIVLEGDLTEEQRQRLLEIADLCPVHKTLSSEIKIRTTLD
jgi:putative redox protein